MFKLLKNLKTIDYGMMAICLCLVCGMVYLDLKLPDYMSDILVLTQTAGNETYDIIIAGLKMIACALGSLLLAIMTGYLSARISADLSVITRKKLYEKVQNFSKTEMNQFSTNSLITRSTNDISQIQMFTAMGLVLLLKAPITAVWAIIKILGKGWQWTLATGVGVVILLLTVSVIGLLVIPKYKKIQNLTDGLNRTARENLNGIRVVRAFNAEEYETNKFESVNNELTKTNIFTNKMLSIMFPVMMLIMSGLSLAIYWIGAYIINDVGMSEKIAMFGDMIVFINYSAMIIFSFVMLILVFVMMPRAIVSAKRINEVLETKNVIYENRTPFSPKECGTIEFKNVNFKYPSASEYILKNLSFKVNKGETLAIIGATGSGKTSVVQLMARLYDVTEGEVLIDGVNIKDIPFDLLYSRIAYVPQKAELFSGTVKSNITLGTVNGEVPTNINEALEISASKEFVDKLDDEENSPISQGGSNLSGGQKQRLSLARAIARKPEIIIFDDSFSALDFRTDKKVRSEIADKLTGTTCVIVAQRVGTIMNADRIIVLDNGNIIGEGTHKELLKKCDIYKSIATLQLSKEEL